MRRSSKCRKSDGFNRQHRINRHSETAQGNVTKYGESRAKKRKRIRSRMNSYNSSRTSEILPSNDSTAAAIAAFRMSRHRRKLSRDFHRVAPQARADLCCRSAISPDSEHSYEFFQIITDADNNTETRGEFAEVFAAPYIPANCGYSPTIKADSGARIFSRRSFQFPRRKIFPRLRACLDGGGGDAANAPDAVVLAAEFFVENNCFQFFHIIGQWNRLVRFVIIADIVQTRAQHRVVAAQHRLTDLSGLLSATRK